MSFREKSAWIMSLALLLGTVFYGAVVGTLTSEMGELAPPLIRTIVVYTIILVVVAILGHAVAAIFAPKEANAPMDERDQRIVTRAGHISGEVFGFGVIMFLGVYLFYPDGNVLFYGVFGSLIIGQLVEYGLQIFLYRKGV